MSNKDPAVLFYTSDFLAGAALMTMKERGQYITLLCLQRERGHMSMKEMEKAAGKLSEEVKGKFKQDEDGKYFNQRMEKEIHKRDAHCRKQKENVSKRWNKPNDDVGINDGNTMVLPLGNGNGNNNVISYESNDKGSVEGYVETIPPVSPLDPGTEEAVSYFLDRVNPMASQTCLDELVGYAKVMGAAVCKRAMDIALDNKSAKWSYIKAILADKQSRGVRCLADWDNLEKERAEKNISGGQGNSGNRKRSPNNMVGMDFNPDLESIRKNNESLDKFLRELEGDGCMGKDEQRWGR